MIKDRGCVTEPPPEPPKLERTDCEHEICLDRKNAGQLMDWAGSIWRWASDTWHKCKPEGE